MTHGWGTISVGGGMAVNGSRGTNGPRLTPGSPPERFSEDLAWLPDDHAFSHYPDGTDLGTMLTDESYDVLMFARSGPAATDAFDAIRLRCGPGGTRDATWSHVPVAAGVDHVERLDAAYPLLVLSRRGEPRPFAAVQTWDLIERLIAQDEPRRERGAHPAPDLRKLDPPKAQAERAQLGMPRHARRLMITTAAVLVAFAALRPLVTPSTDAVPPAPEPAPALAPAPAPAPAPEPVLPPVDVVLTFEAASWLEVTVDGVTEEPGMVIAAGETLRFSGQEVVSLRLGNAGGVRIELNGEDLGVAGNAGQVLRRSFGPDGPVDG
jgi:hypothetical protein